MPTLDRLLALLPVDVLLAVFTYGGMLLSTITVIWGLTQELYTKDDLDRRHLTAAGRYSIGLTVLGLLISVNSVALKTISQNQNDALSKVKELERQRQEDEARRKVIATIDRAAVEQPARELRRTQEIVASGQQLHSLQITWTFSNAPRTLSRAVIETERNIPRPISPHDLHARYLTNATRRHRLVYPWIYALATGTVLTDNNAMWAAVVMLVQLNDDRSSLIPLGRVRYNENTKGFPAAIEYSEDFLATVYPGLASAQSFTGPSRLFDFEADLNIRGAGVEVQWRIPAGSLQRAIDQRSSDIVTTATFPEGMQIHILNNFRLFPVSESRFTRVDNGAWLYPKQGRIDAAQDDALATSVLALEPNGLKSYAVKYRMAFKGRSRVIAEFDAVGTNTVDYCDTAIWEGTRIRE